ncbi:MAG: UDP-3-O-(3-hydroxymyristoyl)glucosamine N-acyltransferase [Prevotella sp.]|nr:UDP-3-O-(3-hydroxymyristoyl)glucosamine N-acyltransferase [Prevotella sp.]
MEFTAKQIAELINGTIEGDENASVSTFAKIEEGRKGAISFLSNPKYTHYIYDTDSSVVIINKDLELENEVKATLIRVDNAYECVAKLLQMYESMKPQKTGIDSLAFISPKATIGKNCYIGAFAFIGDGVVIGDNTQIYPNTYIGDKVTIGNDCIINPNVTIYQGCIVNNRVTIHSGTVIGADGFGFAPSENGYDKIPQIGIVTIEDDVEIGANTCIDRSTMGSTYIRKGAKLDNLIQIAHNAEVGKNTVMAAQCGIAGSTKVGDWCMFGGQVGIAGHLHITDHTTVGAQAGITGSIKKEGQTIIGSPAIDAKTYMKSYAVYRRLTDMYMQINKMQKEIEELKRK